MSQTSEDPPTLGKPLGPAKLSTTQLSLLTRGRSTVAKTIYVRNNYGLYAVDEFSGESSRLDAVQRGYSGALAMYRSDDQVAPVHFVFAQKGISSNGTPDQHEMSQENAERVHPWEALAPEHEGEDVLHVEGGVYADRLFVRMTDQPFAEACDVGRALSHMQDEIQRVESHLSTRVEALEASVQRLSDLFRRMVSELADAAERRMEITLAPGHAKWQALLDENSWRIVVRRGGEEVGSIPIDADAGSGEPEDVGTESICSDTLGTDDGRGGQYEHVNDQSDRQMLRCATASPRQFRTRSRKHSAP